MPGRNAQPLSIIKAKGHSHHLTKKEVERRKAAEIKISKKTFKACPQVLMDPRALREFRRIKKLYQEIEFVGSLDEHLINQYCLSVAELDDLVAYLASTREKMRSELPSMRADGISQFMAVDIEVRMKRQEIVRMSDRLYLNPVSRTKNVPKKAEDSKADPNASMFGDGG